MHEEEKNDYKEKWDRFSSGLKFCDILNPSDIIIDYRGVRTYLETYEPHFLKYECSPCKCGIKHLVGDCTWYHAIGQLPREAEEKENPLFVLKRCKNCHEVLFLRRDPNK